MARIIVVRGSSGGVFIYDNNGNLTASIAEQNNVDPITHSNTAGIAAYNVASAGSQFQSFVDMFSAVLQFATANPSHTTTLAGTILVNHVTAASAAPFMAIQGPAANVVSPKGPEIRLLGESQDASKLSQVQLSVGPAIVTPLTKALLEVDGSGALIPGTITSAVTGTPGLVVGGPASTSDSIVAISDDPANPRALGASMLEIIDQFNAPIFDVPPAGGPKTFGDFMGVWLGVFSGATCQMLPWGGMQPSGFTTIGGSAPSSGGAAMYSGPGAPPNATIVAQMNTYMTASGATAFHQQGDMYMRTDGVAGSWLYRCSVSGTALAPGGTWVNMV